MKVVGSSITRVDAKVKASGELKYTDDLAFSGLHAVIVRSTVASGEILNITFEESFNFSECVVVDYHDIEGENTNTIILDDQPFLAQKYVRFIGEPILLLAHRSKEFLLQAKKHITIKYKESEPLLTMEDSFTKKKIIFGEDNIYKNIELSKREQYKDYLFMLFTDKTSGITSYGGGRYLDLRIPKNGNKLHIDFNKAYNPYCAYNHKYSCPIPSNDDYLDMEIKAGVKKWH